MKTIYDLRISVVTPLHVGSGEPLELNLDYAVHKGRTWVIDQDAFARRKLLDADGGLRADWAERPPGKMLGEGDFQPGSSLFRYVLRGTPRAGRTGAAVQTVVKDVHDRPYLPGSSLKGALRTVIFRHAFDVTNERLSPARLNRSRSWAAQKIERDLLGKDPNHDLLRALHVGDSRPLEPEENLWVLNAYVVGSRSVDTPIALEAVKGDAVFEATMTVDDYLFESKEARKELGFGARRQWLTDLPALANAQAARRMDDEVQAFRRLASKSGAEGVYNRLANALESLGPQQFLLQIGWGGGWDSKTLGYLVPDAELEGLIDRYNLARRHRNQGDPFPRTRRAIGNSPQEPLAPLGWVLVEMEERGREEGT